MDDKKINIRVRMVIVRDGKLLTQYRKNGDYYHYIGGHLEYGETLLEGAIREIAEECSGAEFKFKKILYIRDFLLPEKNEHSVEFFILGEIDKFEELEGLNDPQHSDGTAWCSWLDIENLPSNLYPAQLAARLLEDYKNGFAKEGEYIGRI